VHSSYASNRVYIKTQIDRWDGTKWVWDGTTAEWAYGNTNTWRDGLGYPLQMISDTRQRWISTGIVLYTTRDSHFNFVVPSVVLSRAPGHYRAWTWFRDNRDGELTYTANTLAGAGTATYCQVT